MLRWRANQVGFGIAACCVCLCVLFGLDLNIITWAVHARPHALPPNFVPIATIQPGGAYLNDLDSVSAIKVETIAILETLVLITMGWLLTRRAHGTRAEVVVLSCSAVIMAMLALTARVSESPDIYLYVGLTKAMPSPYDPSAIPFSGDLREINLIWGAPIVPSAYGPLWIEISKLALGHIATLAAKLFTLRLVGLAALAVFIFSLLLLRLPRIVVGLVAMNPVIYYLFVVEAHNDLTGVALVMTAAVVRSRSRLAAVILCAAAGAVKLPFVVIAMLVFVPEAGARARVGLAFASAVLSVTVSLAWAGPRYLWALHRNIELTGGLGSAPQIAFHVAIASAAIATIAFAVIRGRFLLGTPWLMPALGNSPLPQYLGWSLPVVALDPKPNWIFLATMPLIAFMFDTAYSMTPLTTVLVAALAAGLLLSAGVLVIRRAWFQSAER